MNTYTSPYGSTQPGQNLQQLTSTLGNITSTPPAQLPNVSQQQSNNATANAANFASQYPAYMQKTTNQLTQQSGIPGLQNQQSNLASVFPLWLADQGLASKYASQQVLGSSTSPAYGATPTNQSQAPDNAGYTGPANPYLNAPQDIINAVTPPTRQGFQGFSSPFMATSTMGNVPSAGMNEYNLLTQLLGQEQGLVGKQANLAGGNYQSASNMLSTVANALSKIYQDQSAQAGAVPAQTGQVFSAILDQLGPNATPDNVWSYLNTHDAALRAQGADIDSLWALQKDMADKNVISTATGRVSIPKTQIPKAKQDQSGNIVSWTLPTGRVLTKASPSVFGIQLWGGQPLDVTTTYQAMKGEGYSDADIEQVLTDPTHGGWK